MWATCQVEARALRRPQTVPANLEASDGGAADSVARQYFPLFRTFRAEYFPTKFFLQLRHQIRVRGRCLCRFLSGFVVAGLPKRMPQAVQNPLSHTFEREVGDGAPDEPRKLRTSNLLPFRLPASRLERMCVKVNWGFIFDPSSEPTSHKSNSPVWIRSSTSFPACLSTLAAKKIASALSRLVGTRAKTPISVVQAPMSRTAYIPGLTSGDVSQSTNAAPASVHS